MPLLAVNYHYFRNERPPQGIYPISPEGLLDQVKTIQRFWRIGNEGDILSHCRGEARDAAVCILTFDDGLKEQMGVLDCLAKAGVTSQFFVPTGPLVEGKVLDVHKLHMVRSRLNDEAIMVDLKKIFGFDDGIFDNDLLAIQYRYDSPISRQVKYYLNFIMPPDDRDDWVAARFTALFGSERAACEALYMGAEDIRQLAKRHLLGTHAHSHVPLALLPRQDMQEEIGRSLDILEDISGQRVRGISYPFGGKSAVSEVVFDVSAELGLDYGFTMERGISDCPPKYPLALRRIDTNDLDAWVSLAAVQNQEENERSNSKDFQA